jgi:hypothetical protein
MSERSIPLAYSIRQQTNPYRGNNVPGCGTQECITVPSLDSGALSKVPVVEQGGYVVVVVLVHQLRSLVCGNVW